MSVAGSPSSPPLPSMVPACKGVAISGSIRKLRAQPPPPQMLAQALTVLHAGVIAATFPCALQLYCTDPLLQMLNAAA